MESWCSDQKVRLGPKRPVASLAPPVVQECRGKAADAAAGKAQADDDSSGHKQPTTQPALCLGLHSATQHTTHNSGRSRTELALQVEVVSSPHNMRRCTTGDQSFGTA